tara:strand:+ start:251 stop:421 length:171 start_codon:yes stop_codon:yes gene_type:complete
MEVAEVETHLADKQIDNLNPEVEIVGRAIILGTVESSILEDKFRLKRTSHTRGLIS